MASTQRPGPIPSTLAEERGCPSFWGVLPADIEPQPHETESTRGIVDELFERYVCGTKLACSAWANASPTDDDQPVTIEGKVESSYVAAKDLPFNHSSHDWIVNVATGPEYIHYHSDANPINDSGQRVMHCEWEIGALRSAFPYLPSTGDHVWVTGRWVFDCAHLKNCKTEIHPPEAMASWRPETFFDQSRQHAVAGIRVSAIVTGDGGPCNRKETVGGEYRFSVPIPARPGVDARLVVLHDSRDLLPSVEPRFESGKAFVDIQLPFSRGEEFPAETWVSNTWFGWFDPAHPVEHRRATVTLKSLRILRTHDQRPVSEGEWNLWVNVNGQWLETIRNQTVSLGEVVDLVGLTVPLIVGRPESPNDPAVTIETTGWEGDLIDRICGFGDDDRRGVTDVLDRVDTDQAKAWLVRQIDKFLNQRLSTVRVGHRWNELSGTQTVTAHAESPEVADFELTYDITVE